MALLPGLSELRIPEQKKEKSWFDVRPKQVKAWVETLPLGDTEETSKQIFAVLSHINRVQISAPARLKALECLQETFDLCIRAQKNNFVGQSFPLGSRALKYVDRCIAMHHELAIGYKISSIELIGHSHFYEKKYHARALYRALNTLGNILLLHYQIYAPEPPQLWSDIHALYSTAEQHALHKQVIISKFNNEQKDNLRSVGNKYKQLLLLSLSNPYHLGRNDAEKVHEALQEWSASSHILNPAEVSSGEAHFVTCLNRDSAPVQLSLIKTLENNMCRFIDTTDLIQHLRYMISLNLEPEEKGGNLSSKDTTLYRQLLNAWDTRAKRSFSRSPSSGGIDISIGLNSTHFLIEESNVPVFDVEEPEIVQNDGPLIDDTRNPLDISHTTFSIEPVAGEADGEMYWDSTRNTASQNLTQLSGEADNDISISKPTFNCHAWKTLNISAGGYCLLWDHDKSSNAQIGEIVGLRESGNGQGDNWRIGVVRWMQYLRNQGLKLGIQILSPNVTALQSKLMNGRASKKKEYSCLSLPELKAIKEPASILTPSLHYKVGDALILNDHGNMMNVQLTRLVENTGNYSRFQFSPLNTRENKAFEKDISAQENEWKRLW